MGDDSVVSAFYEERAASIELTGEGWMPRTLDSDVGIAADFFRDRHPVATVVFDYDIQAATVYVTSPGGLFGDTTICEDVSFAEAVETAEQTVH